MVPTLTAQQAVYRLRQEGLHISPDVLMDWLENGQLPFGVCIPPRGDRTRRKCWVFPAQLEKWIDERSVSTNE